MKNEIVLFTDGDVNIEVQINPEQETVWLTQKQMEVLFDVKHATAVSYTHLDVYKRQLLCCSIRSGNFSKAMQLERAAEISVN